MSMDREVISGAAILRLMLSRPAPPICLYISMALPAETSIANSQTWSPCMDMSQHLPCEE